MPPHFPTLPIVTPNPPRKTTAEKYGAMLPIGISGLVILVGMIGWFSWQLVAMRGVWHSIYVLHDANRPEPERIAAAVALSRDPRVNQRQRFEMVERQKGLPPRARYVLAESLTAEAAQNDPRAYALAIARSRGWPDWLRVLLARPIAYAAVSGTQFPTVALVELGQTGDDCLGAWVAFARVAGGDPSGEAILTRLAAKPGNAAANQARRLLDALHQQGGDRLRRLDEATTRLRVDQPGAAEVWAEPPRESDAP